MTDPTTPVVSPMNVEEYLAWYDARPDDARYELHDGVPTPRPPERVTHAETKLAATDALRRAIGQSGLPCHVVVDGPQVIIRDNTTYEPDVIVYCGDKIVDDRLSVPDPIIVVEVSSPSTDAKDGGDKLRDYFTLASVQHYIRIFREKRLVLHHARLADETLTTRFCQPNDALMLNPPGLSVAVADLFELTE